MAEGDRGAGSPAVGPVKPGKKSGWRRSGSLLGGELQGAIFGAKADPCEDVDDRAQALRPLQPLVPALRLVAIHLAQETIRLRTAQNLFDLLRKADALLR